IRWTARSPRSTRHGRKVLPTPGLSARWIRLRGWSMSSARPDLSIVICTRNRAGQLQGTLDSLLAMKIARTWEAILVDNPSTDGTGDVTRRCTEIEPRIHYFREERIGLGAARDRGWREAQAPVIALTDDDCYVTKDYVRARLAGVTHHPPRL